MMPIRKIVILCIVLALAFPVACVAAESEGTGPSGNAFIPAGTQVAVQLVDSVSSKSTFVGETLMVSVLEDVILNNVVVIEKGSNGYISVLEVKKAGDFGKSGGIVVQPQYLKTANWLKVPLKGVVQSDGNGHPVLRGGVGGGAGKSWNPLGFGGFAGLLLFTDPTTGGDAEIPSGTKLIVTVSQNVDLGVSLSELAAAMTAEPTRRSQTSLSGISSGQNWAGEYISSRGKIVLTQKSGSMVVKGRYERGHGVLNGQIVGNRLVGKWIEDPSDKAPSGKGQFEFMLSSDGLSVMMLWKNDFSDTWKQDKYSGRLSQF